MEWKKYKLGEILIFNNGKSRPVNKGSYPLYGGNGIVDYVSDYLFEDNIIIGRVGANCGSIHNCDGKCWVSDNAISVNVKNGFDKRYVYYLLKMLDLNKKRIGAAQPLITQEIIAGLNVILPPIDEQHKIGELLSTLDRKIALNKRINHNLEAMAKQLYDYWFVQFDFPNAEGKPYKSSGGKMVWNEKLKREIPDGWSCSVIEDVADVYNGATPSTVNEENYGGNIVWITPKDLSNQQEKFIYQGERNITQTGYDSCSTHLLPSKAVLMSSRAPIGLLAIARTELCTNQGFKSFVPKSDNFSTYLYYYLSNHIKQIEQLGTGTTFKEVSRDDVLKFGILKPTNQLLDKWEAIVSGINDKQLAIQKENESLTKQRDELLPLLMNGQATVNSD